VQVCIHEKKRKEHCKGIRVRECGLTDDKHDNN
jgi:hypothetical protein